MAKDASQPQETVGMPRPGASAAPGAPEMATLAATAEDLSSFGPGRRVGPYRILGELGRGGMGAVFLAERADAEFTKKVAIKLVQAGADRGEVVQRFRRERQILAALDHPNVARLLDGGTTEEGLPYFVMEHIEGDPITTYSDTRRLPVVERLKLFLSVCSAVQYAHRNLIVHRDIKPGNILVTRDGVPRLLDFGIAKLLSPGPGGDEATQTSVAMTPAYASPEQVRGEAITTASDVYSLGVLLFELLTGHHPYRLKNRQPLEYLKAICEQEAERPSTAIDRTLDVAGPDGSMETVTAESVSRTREGTPERLRLRLRGDVDNIVMLALRKEPQQRYGSVEAFAEDVRRYLDGRPVRARKGTLAYRAGKFAGRNKWAVAAAVAVAALLAGWMASLKVQSERIARERDKAERVAGFMKGLFHVSNPSFARGNTVTAREVLDQGVARIREDRGLEPEVRAALLNSMAEVYDSLGLYEQAIPLARESVDIRRRLHRRAHPDVAISLNALGNILMDKGDYGEAEPVYREALDIRRTLEPGGSPQVAESLNNLASVLQLRGRLEESEALFVEALALKRRLYGDENESVAVTLGNIAVVRYARGDLSGAEERMREALAVQRKVLGEDHLDVATTLHNLGVIDAEKGEWTHAEAAYRDALARQRKILGAEHADVAMTLHNLGNAVFRRGDLDAAEALYRESLAMQRKVLGDANVDVATNLAALGAVAVARGDAPAGEDLWRQSLAMRTEALGESHADTGASLAGLARALADRGRLPEAESSARRGAEVRRAALDTAHPDLAESLLVLADVLALRGRGGEGEPLAREALAILQGGPEAARWRAAEAESVLGACLASAARAVEAEPLLVAGHAALVAKVGERGPQAVLAQRRLERLRDAAGRR